MKTKTEKWLNENYHEFICHCNVTGRRVSFFADMLDKFAAQSSENDKAIIEKQEEYIKCLTEELDETAVIAHTHGWRSTRADEGKKLRAELQALKDKRDAT